MRPMSTEPREEQPQPPSSTGLIRLTLRKPMGIVFEPMTDSSGAQRGVRICDLPRTGAAALSRKLEVGDELLSINDRTMSRLTFDEIMDYIIEADPDRVSLLFRRPRKDHMPTKAATTSNTMPMPISAPNNSVKWADDHDSKPSRDRDRDKDRRDHDRDRPSSERLKQQTNNMNKKRRNRERKDEPWASENFLDMLIDSLCSPLVNDQCKQAPDEDSDADDDETYFSKDDSTYVTYESIDDKPKARKGKFKDTRRDDDSTVDNETMEDEDDSLVEIRIKNDVRNRKTSSRQKVSESENEPYTDDGTLETVESTERAEQLDLNKKFMARKQTLIKDVLPVKEDAPPVPIKELEYDIQADAADVSVMTPSLVDTYVSNTALSYGRHNYSPHEPGLTVDESIQKSPQRFYRHVVQHLLETHEPEKVRLLDKLMAKYSGREEHLIQKLTLRYNRQGKMGEKKVPTIQEDESYKDINIEETPPHDEIKNIEPSGSSVVNTASLASFVTMDNKSHDAATNAKMRFANKLEENDTPAKEEPDPQITPPVGTPEKHTLKELVVEKEDATLDYKPKETMNEDKVTPVSPLIQKEESKSFDESETTESSESSESEEEEKFMEPVKPEPKDHIKNISPREDIRDPQIKPSHDEYTQEVEAEGQEVGIDSVEEGSYSGDSAYSGSSLDGTSPAVIAQISELLNYVYGKTTVPGQIDRVSTIMRAYEGREVVLLELLETKALLKANAQSEQQQSQQVTSPLSMSGPSVAVGGEFVGREMHDDMSSVSGASFKYNMKNFSDPSSPNHQNKITEPPQVQRSKSQPSSQKEKLISKKPSIDPSIKSKEKKKFFSLKLFKKKDKKKFKNKNVPLTRVDSGERSI